jgi:hypothetical protein
MRERTVNDKKQRITKKYLDTLVTAARSAIERAKTDSTKTSVLMVSRNFLDAFYRKNKICPIMICGLFYEIDENLNGVTCYVRKEY